MIFTEDDIENIALVKRLNLINSITGIKPANLIGTISNSGNTNLAIFSSVIHLGSNPALIGFILRPETEVRRDTYENIRFNKQYTINHVATNFTKKAHNTSLKFDSDVSEFHECGLTEEYINGFEAPFVKESKLKIGLEFLESIPIPINKTSLMIGKVKMVIIEDKDALSSEGYIDLQALDNVGISGLNTYYSLKKESTYPYAKQK